MSEIEKMAKENCPSEICTSQGERKPDASGQPRESATFPPMTPGYFSMVSATIDQKVSTYVGLKVGYFSELSVNSSDKRGS